jgi:hypothetical protein
MTTDDPSHARHPVPVDPESGLNEELPDAAECPFCGGRETRQFASFGSALSTSQYYCDRCRTVFEYMKWRSG